MQRLIIFGVTALPVVAYNRPRYMYLCSRTLFYVNYYLMKILSCCDAESQSRQRFLILANRKFVY
jgi:hypothetical protein